MITNYDDIYEDYLRASGHPLKKYCESFTFIKILGDLKGQSVLDVACGDGYYTRLIKQQGAEQVVGLDISHKMIKFAEAKEQSVPLGIRYQLADIIQVGQIGQFDRVTAVFLFPYAATKQLLKAMFQAIYDNLKPGGKLVAITLDPNLTAEDLPVFEQYGVKFTAEAGLQDGKFITATVAQAGGNSFKIENYWWGAATYQSVMDQVGFRAVRWHPIQVSEVGLKAYGSEYWQAYTTKPYSIVLECDK